MSAPVLAIVGHSRTGAGAALAQAAATGAGGDPAVCVRLLEAARTVPADLLGAHGFVFVAPENLGTLSGVMKDLLDRAYYPLLGQVEGRPYASMIAAGSDGRGAQAQLDRIVTGWRLRRVAEPMIVNLGAQSPAAILAPKVIAPADLARAAALGLQLSTGMALGIY